LNPVLSLRDVGVLRDDRWILREVSLEIAPCLVTGVVGPSGAGKTTLLRLCNRLDAPDTGTILLRGRDTADVPPPDLRRRVAMVFQRPTLLGGTVRDDLLLARRRGEEAGDAVLADALRRVSLDPEFLDRSAAELSGGEAQRVCLARALLTEPEVLLLDEPTSALDAGPRLAFERQVAELCAGGLTALWVTHDLDQLHRVAQRVVVLVDGRVGFAGLPAHLAERTDLVDLLTGEATDGR
jgi:putative ABC transport system ATP-binding protein